MRILHKTITALGLGLLLSATNAQTTVAANVRQITLAEALIAASQNIDAQIAKQQMLASRADITAANHAPAPVLSTSISQIDLQNGVGAGSWLGDKRVDKSLGIDWTWERGDKRTLRTQAATQTANASTQDLNEAVLQQKLLAQAAFFDLFAAQERLEQIKNIAQSAQQLASAAAKRLAAGDLSSQDAARSNIEFQRAQNDITLAEQDRARAELALNLVLDAGSQKLIAVKLESASSQIQIPPEAAATALPAIESRADVQAANARVEAARAQLNNALALQKSDVTLGTAIDHFPGTSNRLLMFRMQMPLQIGALGGYTFQGEIDRARAQLTTAEAQLERVRHSATNEALRLTQELKSSQQRAQNYQLQIAPEAKRIADLAELAYNKGALSLTDLLEARRTWRATTLEAIAAQLDFEKARAARDIRMEVQK